MEINSRFKAANIPLDVIWMDIPHSDGNKYFVFDPRKFNDAEME